MGLKTNSYIVDKFFVSEARLLKTKTNQDYYNLTVNLEGGKSIDAKIWSNNIKGEIEAGMLLDGKAKVGEYQGNQQLIIGNHEILKKGEFDPSSYITVSDIDVDEAYDALFRRNIVEKVCYKGLIESFGSNKDFEDQFKVSPAAKSNHHNYQGGLIQHTFDVVNIACAIANESDKHEEFNIELLITGAILHDIGKMQAYSIGAGVSEYTDDGVLLDHIFMGASTVHSKWVEVHGGFYGNEERDLLHLILSHHGQKEWGSPVLPKTSEAVVLHFADQLSATLETCFASLEEVEEGGWSDWIDVFGGLRKLYKTERSER